MIGFRISHFDLLLIASYPVLKSKSRLAIKLVSDFINLSVSDELSAFQLQHQKLDFAERKDLRLAILTEPYRLKRATHDTARIVCISKRYIKGVANAQ